MALLPVRGYLFRMKGLTIKLTEELHRRLAAEARASGRSLGAVIRGKLEGETPASSNTVHERAADLAGTLSGSRRTATNDRRKFRRH